MGTGNEPLVNIQKKEQDTMALKRVSKNGNGHLKWGALVGRIVLVTPKSFEKGVETVHGPSDAVKADVVVLDGPDAPIVYTDTLVFATRLRDTLVDTLKDKNGQVLARVAQGQAKPGKSAPWLFDDASDDEAALELATPYLLGDGEEDELPY